MDFMDKYGYGIPTANGPEISSCCKVDQPLVVKDILERNDAVLNETKLELIHILMAISGEGAIKDEKLKPQDECMLNTLARQHEEMEEILNIICKIRERLW